MRGGKLFRSDALHRLDRADLETLEELGLRTVFDLRAEGEREGAEDRLPTGELPGPAAVQPPSAGSILPGPSQILLDLMIPAMDGFEFAM